MNLIYQLRNYTRTKQYWLIYITGSFLLLATALYYQHVLEELPCVACIQMRLWISLLLMASIVGLIFRNIKLVNTLTNLSVVLIAAGMLERSYLLLGTERGFIFSDCGFSLGLPAWFAIEEWLPWLYRIETSCGYTPEIVFSITMAETLIVLSGILFLVSISVFIATLITDFIQPQAQD